MAILWPGWAAVTLLAKKWPKWGFPGGRALPSLENLLVDLEKLLQVILEGVEGSCLAGLGADPAAIVGMEQPSDVPEELSGVLGIP
jgi:hypothetical protein